MFESKGMPRTKVIEYVSGLDYREMVTYETLQTMLGDVTRGDAQNAVNRALRELESVHRKTLINVRGAGYRVAHPDESEKESSRHQTKAKRQIRKARSKVDNVDLAHVSTPEIRKDIEAQSMRLAKVEDAVKVLTRKSARHDKLIALLGKEQQTISVDVSERLAAIEAKVGLSVTAE